MDSVRRCRRCKRKRLDDEPPEVQQYKTCAKCRIIERNKKNSRKPLAEETMLYGLKQFKEQSIGGNYMEDEGLLRDEFFRRYHNKPFNYEVELHKVILNPNYTPPALLPPQKSYTFKAATTAPLQIPSSLPQQYTPQGIPPISNLLPQQYTNQHHSAINQYNRTSTKTFDHDDDIYTELDKLGNKDSEKESTDSLDPYSYSNVFNNYKDYLLEILKRIKNNESIENLVYLKEFNDEFTFNLSRTDKEINKINGESHFRSILLTNLKNNYIDPIIAILSIDFNQSSNNLNDFKQNLIIKSFLRFDPNLPSSSISNQSPLLKNSSIFLIYDRKYNLLILKTNSILHKPSNFKYSLDLKKKINEILKTSDFEKSNNLLNNKSDYNVSNGISIYDRLLSDDLFSNEINKIDRESFVGDFINFDKVFIIDEESDDEEDEEDEDDEDEDDEDDDDSMDLDADTTIFSPKDELDPILNR